MALSEGRLSVAYILTPIIAVAVAAPAILHLPMHMDRKVWFSPWPFWLGLVCSPGYIYCWSDRWRRGTLRRAVRLWVAASLVGAAVASASGAALMLLTGIFWIFSAMSAGCCIHMLRRFVRIERGRRGTER
jgi:hypothetical protein